MDKTNSDEQKTERFNMFMSPSEMAAIDDWAWKNKVRSKSEAVRRLVQIGLALDVAAPRIVEELERQLTPDQNFEPSPDMRALYDVLGPLIIGRLGIRSMSDMQTEVDQSPVLRALWDGANQQDEEEK
ncbi:hypothetical protein EDF68_104139 [Ochrobactrum sp. BH3]|nr:hypothetical protein EDF68_104139 [Ochrobactrum sp. BH3]